MKTDVTCYGISCADVLIRGFDMSTPFKNEMRFAEQVSIGVGGDATNQAIVLSRLGASVKLVSGLGTDNVGLFIRTIVEGAGVDTSQMIASPGASVISVVIIDEAGQRNIVHAKLADCTNYEPNLEAMKGSKVVSIGSINHPPFTDVNRILKVVKAAKEEGAIVCADVIARHENHKISRIAEALPYIDYIFPNESEAAMLTGETDIDKIADTFLRYGVGNVVMKVGKDGCVVKNSDGTFRFPAMGKKAIDTTGAGDNFLAGFIAGLLDGKNLEGCCRFASATAGIAVETVGANTGVKSRRQVEDFIRENSSK